MNYCKRCVLPDTHETIQFDGEGICNICRQAEVKHKSIDWNERKEILDNIVNKYRDKGEYDCILPFSGGKDSTFQLWYIIKELKLKPLIVRYNHWGFRPLVNENNIKVLKQLGADMIDFRSNWHVVKKIMRESLKRTGDFCWHCHAGVFANTLRIAVKFNIPLVIFGESSAEYRAYNTFEEISKLDKDTFEEMVNLGISAEDMYIHFNGEIPLRDLLTFTFPSNEELAKLEPESIYLGNYIKWDTKENVRIIKKELGWKGQQVEGIPPEYDYEKIECRWQGIRDYCKYIKRGHGRTNHLMCIDIRSGRMDRETALKYYEEYDGKRPYSLDSFLELLNMTEDQFIDMLQDNKIEDWGFDKATIKMGKELEDMKDWDKL